MITNVRKLDERRAWTDQLGRGVTEYYLVKSDSRAESHVNVKLADLTGSGGLAIPRERANVHPDDETLICDKVEVYNDGQNVFWWRCAVDYRTPEGRGTSTQISVIVPWQREADLEVFAVTTERAFTTDVRGGFPVVNSANQPFVPAPTMEDTLTVIRFTRNQQFFNYHWPKTYQNTVNAETLGPYGPNECLMKELRAVRVTEKDYTFFRVMFEIWIKGEVFPGVPGGLPVTTGWRRVFMSTGLDQFVVGTGLVPIKDGHGNPVNDPKPLKGNGRVWRDPLDPAAANESINLIDYMRYDDKKALTWNPLGLVIPLDP